MPRQLPSADELGVSMFEQLLGHSGKQRMRELIEPEKSEEKPAEEQLDVTELERLLGPQEG